MKKILSLAILLMVFVGFTACSNDDEEQTYSLVGKRFQVEPANRSEMIDQDGDSVIWTVSRSIQFIDEKTAIMVCTMEYEYPGHPEWYSLDYGYFYMESQFNGKVGTLTVTKMTMIMTGYYDDKLTMYYEAPYSVWDVKKDETGKGLMLVQDDGLERVMESVAPIKDLQWQEFPPMGDMVSMYPNGMLNFAQPTLLPTTGLIPQR